MPCDETEKKNHKKKKKIAGKFDKKKKSRLVSVSPGDPFIWQLKIQMQYTNNTQLNLVFISFLEGCDGITHTHIPLDPPVIGFIET